MAGITEEIEANRLAILTTKKPVNTATAPRAPTAATAAGLRGPPAPSGAH